MKKNNTLISDSVDNVKIILFKIYNKMVLANAMNF